MSVEIATKVSELNATLPLDGDPRSEGDNHLRTIKTAVLGTLTGADTTGVVGFNVVTQSTSDNSTLAASTALVENKVAAASFATVLPSQTSNSGKFVTTDGTNASWSYTYSVFLDKGNSGTTAQTIDYSAGKHQKITVTGAFTLNPVTNWPSTGKLGEVMLELTNGASSAVTWPTINWVKIDGSFTTTFSSNGVTLQTSGTDFILLWTRDGGTTVYGKVMR